MSDIQKESEGVALALPGLEALLQSYQSINAQISSLNAALQLQNSLLAQTAALAAPTFFSNLTMGLYAMQLAVDALSASYTMLLGKLANSAPVEALASMMADLKLKMGENIIVVNQTIQTGGGLYNSIVNTVGALGSVVSAPVEALANMIASLKHKAAKSTKTFAQPFKMLYSLSPKLRLAFFYVVSNYYSSAHDA